MKTACTLSAVAICFSFTPNPCFALWTIAPVSKQKAKELGMEVRATATGPNQVLVELEIKTEGTLKRFNPEGKFGGFCGVELRIGDGINPLVTAPLREDRSKPKPGRVMVSFTANLTQLDNLKLWVFVPASDGGTIYDLAVKDFVELKKPADVPPNKALQLTGAAFRPSAASSRGRGPRN